MKRKYVLSALALILVGAVVTAQAVGVKSLGFIAPIVNGKGSVPYPAVGEIVYDSSDSTFYGFNQASTWGALGGGSGNGMPSGSVIPFAGTAAPSGFLIADGSAVSRTTYADLFAVVGTTYGAGDGSTTFNLPDLRGIFVRGAGTQTVSSVTYSGTLATKESDQFQGHLMDGYYTALNVTSPSGSAYGISATYTGSSNTLSSAISGRTLVNDGTNGVPRIGTETRPANISLTYIIKI